jgi:hypothetical protein
MHRKLTAGCQILTLLFGFWRDPINIPYFKDGKVLSHLVFMSKVLPGSLTDFSAWVGICTSSQQQCVKYQFLYLDLFRRTL